MEPGNSDSPGSTGVTTLVLGLGNDLLRDEGIGVHAVRRLRDEHVDTEAEFVDGGTLSFTLAVPIAEARRLIIIDAAQLHSVPGTVRLFVNEEMDRFLNASRRASVHEVGLIDLMAVARLTNSLPERRALIAVQPAEVTWGTAPSPAVEQALPAICELTLQLIEQWNHGTQ